MWETVTIFGPVRYASLKCDFAILSSQVSTLTTQLQALMGFVTCIDKEDEAQVTLYKLQG